jgi:thiol-disulfide isomerase/thioredoxin
MKNRILLIDIIFHFYFVHMKTTPLFFSLAVAGTLLFSGCLKNPETPQTPPSTSPASTQTEKPSPEPTDEPIAEEQDDQTDDAFSKAMKITKTMKPNGMEDIKAIYPDLVQSRVVDADDSRNLMGRMQEPWLYSAEHDVTVIVCKEMNTPGHVFKGKNIPQVELDEVKKQIAVMMEDESAMEEKMEQMESEEENDTLPEETQEAETASAQYVDYEAQTFANHKGKKVLFFYADWCPTCRNWESKIQENLAELPAKTFIAKADYDSEAELKKEYGVTVQSTAVFLDDDGTVIGKEADPSVLTLTEFFEG